MKLKGKIKGVVVAAAVALGIGLISGAAAGGSVFEFGKNMEILANMFRDLNLFYVDNVDPDKLLADAAAGMVSELDPYTEYISPEAMSDFETLTTGKYAGVGSLIRQKGDYVLFAQPYKGSPADKAGIEIGDRIVAIEGNDAKGMTTEQVSSRLKGEPGTTVKLEIEKFYTGERQKLRLKRELITMPGVPYYGMVSEKTGYIQHSDFTENCSSDILQAVMTLKEQGAQGLIIDLRGNRGGILQEAVKIVSLFTPKGTEVVSTKAKIKENNAQFLTENEPVDTKIPIVVLVNGGSASAAEIVSGSLQDLDRAVLVGQRTYGKGLVQTPRPLGYDAYLKLTTAKYYLPSGRCIQAIDYTRRNEDGSISYIPDSLVNEFHTRAQRKVYDGGGVMPDVAMEAEYASQFAYMVYAQNYISDFVDLYAISHRKELESIDLDNFRLDQATWKLFTEFMTDKKVGWESNTSIALKTLKQNATRERYIDSIGEQIAQIEQTLNAHNTLSEVEMNRKDLSALIEDEMILRHNYQWGVIRHSRIDDREVAKAIELIEDTDRYNNILAHQDTARK